jgi:hypothetical protein
LFELHIVFHRNRISKQLTLQVLISRPLLLRHSLQSTNFAKSPFFVGSLTFLIDHSPSISRVTVGHLKDAIVKRKPLSFQDVDLEELDLRKVSACPPFSTYADNFPTRAPFPLTGNSRSTLANNSLKMMPYFSGLLANPLINS